MALNPGDKAPAIKLSDQSGETVQLKDLKGRMVLVADTSSRACRSRRSTMLGRPEGVGQVAMRFVS